MRILVTGASGQLGAYLLRRLASDERFETIAWSGSSSGELFGIPLRQVELGSPEDVATAIHDARPDFVLHAAAISRVDVCHAKPDFADRINVQGTRLLTELTTVHGARLVYVSTDLVFNGRKGNYTEEDAASPLSCYGRSKLTGERFVLATPNALVARVSLLFGPSLIGRPTFFDQQCVALRAGRTQPLFIDEWRTPLSLAVAAEALVELATSKVTGTLHVGGPQRLSRFEMGELLAKSLGCDAATLQATRLGEASFPEPRPSDVSLDSSRWRTLFPSSHWPEWDDALKELGVV